MSREVATSMDGVHCFDSCLSIPIRRCVRERDSVCIMFYH